MPAPAELPQKILVVESEAAYIIAIENIAKKHNIAIEKATNWENALYLFNQHKFDLCIIALHMDGMLGTTLIQKWRNHEVEIKRTTAFILCAGKERSVTDDALIKELGDVPVVTRPINPALFIPTLNQAMAFSKQNSAIAQLETKIVAPLLKLNKIDKAMAVAQEKLEPIGTKGKLTSALIHSDAAQYDHAAQLLDGLIKEDPKNMRYHNELGKLQLKKGDLAAAQKSFELADQASPNQIERITVLADIYMDTKQEEKAVGKLKELIDINPDQPDMKFNVMEKLMDKGFPDSARKLFAQTSSTHELIRHYNNRGVMYSKTGKYEEAIKEYEKAAKIIPDSPDLYRVLFNMAISRYNLKGVENLKEAKRILEKVIQINPAFDKAKENLEKISQQLGEKK